MRISNRARFFAGTATTAFAAALSTSPAAAQCTASASAVTCTGTTTVSNANAAIAAATPPAVAIAVQTGATVTADAQNTIQPSGAVFTDAISLANAGTLGTTAAPVNFFYSGVPGSAANTFGLTNSGTVAGYVQTSNVGGAITANNTGTIAGGLYLSGSGNISLTSSGPIYAANGGAGAFPLQLVSSRTTSTTTGTVGTDALTTTTTTGGLVTATITGPIAIPASGTATAAVPQGVFLSGIGGAQLTLNALAGNVQVLSTGGNTTTSIPFPGNTSTAGGVTTTNNANSVTNAGGAASATIGADAQIAGLTVQSGPAAASASVAGKVGSATTGGSVTVSSTPSDTSFASTSTTAATGTTFASTNRSTPVGGAVSVDLASTGQVFGSVSATSNKGAATINIAGTTGSGTGAATAQLGNVSAVSQGQSQVTQTNNSTTAATGDYSNVQTVTRAATGSTAAITEASTGNTFGAVTVTGDAGASFDNAGRLRDGATVTSSRTVTSTDTRSSQATTTAASGATTVVVASSNSTTGAAIGGTASLINRATGTIGDFVGDNVSVSGLAGASVNNAGAIFGNVTLTSSGNTTTNSTTNSTSTISGGGAATVVATTNTTNLSSAPAGGAVTGTYGGTVGAVNGSALAGYRSVNQFGQAGSSATISGVMLADFNGSAGATGSASSSTNTTTTTTQLATAPATPASETVSTGQSRNATTWNSANSAVTVTGSLLNNGFGTGNLSVSAPSGAATASVSGGLVNGSVTVTGGSGSNSTSGSDTASRSTVAATTAGPVPASAAQSSSSTSFTTSRGVGGSAALSLANTTVGGSVSVSGRGTGPSANGGVSTGASLTMASDSTVTGSVFVSSNYGADTRTDSSDVATRTGATAVTRTVNSSTTATTPANYGNATATLAGKSGSVNVDSSFGSSAVSLTGQSTGGVNVSAVGTLSNSSSQTTYTGNSATTLTAIAPTAATSSSSLTYGGGTASLAINTATALQATTTPATAGAITVNGTGGSTLTIAAGSRVNPGNSGSITVGSLGNQSNTFQSSSTYVAGATAGTTVNTGTTSTTTYATVGGPASLTNAGIVGSSTGFFGAPLSVAVRSVGGASATNSGTIYGTVNATAMNGTALSNANQTIVATTTNANDPVLLRTVTTTTNTAAGGAASVTNSGVVSGAVSLAGATGTLTNGGVLRGGVGLGAAVNQYTATTTSTPTSSTTVYTAPTTRFAQTYTANQNGLLIGGVNVTGAVISDPSTGALPTATLRTSDVTATINLNSGSTTLGNVTAQTVSATDNTRLTNTTLNLVDTGFLGAGTTDLPSAAVGTGTGTLKFVNTPTFGNYVAIDPALGTLSGTTFTPAVSLASGSQVTGVTLVQKSGAGVFTVVGVPYLTPTNATSSARYTMDVGTFRINAGEVQLGVAGTDPTTGAGIFAIRGNVENNALLTLGRRVTDGSTTVLQGTSLRVDGNVTQSSTGTLAFAATPALIRQTGTTTGPLVASGILGFGGYGVALSPFVAYNPTNTSTLRSTPSTLTVNGNLTLAGTIAVSTTPGAIYTAGRNQDLITVSGTYSATGLTVNPGFSSPFLTFALTPRTVGTSTVVSLDVARAPYSTVTTNSNAANAANALQATIPNVVSRIAAITNPAGVADVQGYGRLQDLATVISGLDTQLSAADAATALNQLGSGSFYGSLQAISTTAPFGEAVDQLPSNAPSGIGLWFRPTGQFASIDGVASTGSARLRYDNYGGSLGFSVSTGGGVFGIGGGYGRVNAHPAGYPANASANTFMLGAYGGYRFGGINVGAQAVFGWSNWDVSRGLPLFSRTALASFHSNEFRFTARAGYDFDLGGAVVTPFAKIGVRHYTFDRFDEQNAGGIGLAVAKHSETIASPELGVRLAGSFGGLQPFAEASYVFLGNQRAFRTVSYLGDTTTSFRLQGVDPKGYAKLGAGLQADLYGATLYLRGNYLTAGRVNTGEAQGGVVIRF